MDPQQQNQGNFEVPTQHPSADMIPQVPGIEAHPNTHEAAPTIGGAIPVMQMSAPATSAVPTPIFQQSTLPPHQATPVTAPAVADDLDLIEKEWVEKAKAIVAQTRSDPYNQNKEMNRFKADYMQKRYGKDIKLES
jgi:hypothetical protein